MNETIRTIMSLHSVHGDFSSREIDEMDLQQVLECSVRAGTAGGRQSYSILIISDRAVMKDLLGYQASRALLYCVDYNRLTALSDALGYAYDPSTLQDYVTAHTDTVLAAQNAVTAARSLGIDSLITNAPHRKKPNHYYDVLDLPEKNCVPLLAVMLGYSGGDELPGKGRIKGPGIIHWDKYRHMTREETNAMIAEYDATDPQMGLKRDWNSSGHEHYLDWFFGVREKCPRKGEGEAPTILGKAPEYISRAGFITDLPD